MVVRALTVPQFQVNWHFNIQDVYCHMMYGMDTVRHTTRTSKGLTTWLFGRTFPAVQRVEFSIEKSR